MLIPPFCRVIVPAESVIAPTEFAPISGQGCTAGNRDRRAADASRAEQFQSTRCDCRRAGIGVHAGELQRPGPVVHRHGGRGGAIIGDDAGKGIGGAAGIVDAAIDTAGGITAKSARAGQTQRGRRQCPGRTQAKRATGYVHPTGRRQTRARADRKRAAAGGHQTAHRSRAVPVTAGYAQGANDVAGVREVNITGSSQSRVTADRTGTGQGRPGIDGGCAGEGAVDRQGRTCGQGGRTRDRHTAVDRVAGAINGTPDVLSVPAPPVVAQSRCHRNRASKRYGLRGGTEVERPALAMAKVAVAPRVPAPLSFSVPAKTSVPPV